eukprot:360823-Chlamydomonas_euryale.AAC.5
MADGNCVLVDIRSAREKDTGGVPDMPGSMARRTMEVEFAVTEDRRLRGAMRNPAAIEAAVTALQVRRRTAQGRLPWWRAHERMGAWAHGRMGAWGKARGTGSRGGRVSAQRAGCGCCREGGKARATHH